MAKKKKDQSWDEPREAATRTELQTRPDYAVQELLNKASQTEPALIVIQGDMMGRVFRLKSGRNVIGRHPDAQIHIQQRAVSSFHADIRLNKKGSAIIEDLKSLNGTVVNNQKLEKPRALSAGDLLKVGSYVFKYVESQLDASFTESLHEKGSVDALTGAYNKAYLLKALSASIEIARSGFPLSVIIFDLDHFKKVNDVHGHLAGDYVLKECCRLLRDSVIRSDDLLCRFGGEEFVVVMPDTPPKIAKEVAERIRVTLQAHNFEYADTKIPVTASLGVASWGPRFKEAENFIEFVDQLLYISKDNGRNRVTAS